jgi:cytochrome P450
MHDVVREKTAVLCNVLDAYMARGQDTVSLKRELVHFTSDVFAKIGFGVELNCLETGLDGQTHEFVEAFTVASHATEHRLQVPGWLWRLQRFLDIGEEAEFKKSMKIVNEFTYEMIARSMAAKSKRVSEGSDSVHVKDLVSLFLTTSMGEREEITGGDQQVEMEFIRDMAVNFIFAGKDTTSLALSWFVVAINQHPEVVQKIRAELKEHIPSLFNRSSNRIPTIDELKSLVYLEAAIRENLRLNPPAAMVGRTAAVDTMLSDGTPLKAGTRITLALYASARQPTVWGEDCAEFKPERWIDPSTNSIRTISPFKAHNFSAGPRMCPGRHMAMMEMKIALAALLSRYDFTTVENPFKITYEVAITHVVKGDLMVKVAPYAG